MTRIRSAQPEDAARICAIYNQGIAERSSTFETRLREPSEIAARIADQARFPMQVTVDQNERVVGWASLSAYRERACYAGIAEFSIYLDRDARCKGLGRQLLQALIEAAAARGFWKLVSRVFTFNAGSRALCRACGFREVGVYERHAQLDGQWRDVVIVERSLLPTSSPTPNS